jgi:hypothetical protein
VETVKISMVFSDGISRGPAHCRVIVDPIIGGASEEATPNSFVLEWSKQRGVSKFNIDYPLSRITSSPDDESEVIVSGRLGFVGIIRGEQLIEETIEGPDSQGFIRDLRPIGHHLYAVGMGRQVYRRHGPHQWGRFDDGLKSIPEGYLEVTGFNAIDGVSEEDMYAVGFNGEIWHCAKGEWREVTSPTNLILERVRVVRPDLVYAAGQGGILLRGHGDAWESVDQTRTDKNFWGLEWFRDRLYLSTNDGVFRLDDRDELESVDLALPGPRTYSQLHANKGALWSFGPKHLSWTEDGKIWVDAVMR